MTDDTVRGPDGPDAHLEDLARFLAAAPSPFHAVAQCAQRLESAGFERVDGESTGIRAGGRQYVVRDGALLAWSLDGAHPSEGFRIIGAHTDSPNLRIRPHPDRTSSGFAQLGVEIYGGVLLNSWLDRDLGLSGRVVVRRDGAPVTLLLQADEPLLRIPQLAIHLDRSIGTDGLRLDPQRHVVPVWSSGRVDEFRDWLAARLGVAVGDILSWELMTHDLTAPCRIGVDASMFAAPRLDDLLSCHAALDALCAVRPTGPVPVIALFDHEEVGSTSASGAGGPLLPELLDSLARATGMSAGGMRAALDRSICISADGAHATHPNYPERHEPDHPVVLDGGPVIKTNVAQRYATDARGAGAVVELAARLDIPLQHFVSRNDMPCGSTIGPVTAARLGVTTIDMGVAQLSMHSARELTGVVDPHRFRVLLGAFLGESSLPR